TNSACYLTPIFDPAFTNSKWPFQASGAGNYYLTNNSSLRNLGITSLDFNRFTLDFDALTRLLKKTTTYAPILLTNTVSIDTTLSPQAQRDVDTPDLGYHYDPLDFLT